MNEFILHEWKIAVEKQFAQELFSKLNETLPGSQLHIPLKMKNPVGKVSYIEFGFLHTVLDANVVHTRLIRTLAEINDNDHALIQKGSSILWKR